MSKMMDNATGQKLWNVSPIMRNGTRWTPSMFKKVHLLTLIIGYCWCIFGVPNALSMRDWSRGFTSSRMLAMAVVIWQVSVWITQNRNKTLCSITSQHDGVTCASHICAEWFVVDCSCVFVTEYSSWLAWSQLCALGCKSLVNPCMHFLIIQATWGPVVFFLLSGGNTRMVHDDATALVVCFTLYLYRSTW